VKRTFLLLVTCLVALGGLLAPAQARVSAHDVKIVVNGIPFQGEWAFVGERPFVGIESFGKALGSPRQHNLLGWCLETADSATGTCDANPLELAVRSQGQALKTARHGGVTMVDLRQALQVLDIPFTYRLHDRTFMVGHPYFGEIAKKR
jgi:hypothetical protein